MAKVDLQPYIYIYLGEEAQFFNEGISEEMYPRIFTGIAEPWINLLEIKVCDVRFQMLCTEDFKAARETHWKSLVSQNVTTS